MRTTKIALVITLSLLISGCGGDGSSSSGGSSTRFAGTYTGTMIMSLSGFGATAQDQVPITMIISNEGLISLAIPGYVGTGGCSSGPAVYLRGSTFSSSATLTCRSPELGTCTVPASTSGSVSGNIVTGNFSATYRCSVGTFKARAEYSATRRARDNIKQRSENYSSILQQMSSYPGSLK